jgi:hypothetical protein
MTEEIFARDKIRREYEKLTEEDILNLELKLLKDNETKVRVRTIDSPQMDETIKNYYANDTIVIDFDIENFGGATMKMTVSELYEILSKNCSKKIIKKNHDFIILNSINTSKSWRL